MQPATVFGWRSTPEFRYAAVAAAMDRWRAAKRHVRRLQDQIREEQDPTEKADLQELIGSGELAMAAAYAAYEAVW